MSESAPGPAVPPSAVTEGVQGVEGAAIRPEGASPGRTRRSAALQVAIVAGVVAVGIGGAALVAHVQGEAAPTLAAAAEDADLYLALLSKGLLALAALAFVLWRFREPVSSVGLGRARVLPTLGWGLLTIGASYAVVIGIGIATLAIILATGGSIEALGRQRLQDLGILLGVSPWAVLPVAAFAGFWEEVIFRGFLLSRLRTLFSSPGAAPWVPATLAVAGSSVLFGLGHAYQGGLGMVQTLAIGVVMSVVALVRRSVWPCIVAHFGIDVAGLFLLKVLSELMAAAPP